LNKEAAPSVVNLEAAPFWRSRNFKLTYPHPVEKTVDNFLTKKHDNLHHLFLYFKSSEVIYLNHSNDV